MTAFLLLLTAFFWGGTWVAGRVLAQEIPPFSAAFIRFGLASVMFWGLVRWREGPLPTLSRAQWGQMFCLGVSGIFAYNYFFLHGLQSVSASHGALIVSGLPALTALCAWGLARAGYRPSGDTRLTGLQWLGIGLALIGNLWVISSGEPLALWQGGIGRGELLLVGCVFSWLAYTFIGRRASETLSPLRVNFYACSIGALLLASCALFEVEWQGPFSTQFSYSPKAWGSLIFLAFLGTVLGYTWFTHGVKKIGATRASTFINLVPVFGVLLGALLLNERLAPSVLWGGGLTLLGVWITHRAGVAKQ